MKKYFILAAAALAFAACTNKEDFIAEPQAEQQVAEETPLAFSAYLNRGTTRAGLQAELVKANLATSGFGVFGYYTDNQVYSESSTPNFMYNEKVTSTDAGTTWTYAPVKYWPNEFGNDAASAGVDRLTFFAYAPWVEVTPSTGLVTGDQTTGIIALSRNTATGDPYVKYYADLMPSKRVDLCWGVAGSDWDVDDAVVDGIQTATTTGSPFKNMVKTKTDKKIDFKFYHALASLNVTIDTDVDVESHAAGDLATGTKIYVRSITFEGFVTKGMFNLNSDYDEPQWYSLTGLNKIASGSVTVYDGRRDGKEGQVNATASNEFPKDLNTKIIQTEAGTEPGVTHTPENLFNSGTSTLPVYVIPTGEPVKVTIEYDVETADPKLAGLLSDGSTHGSVISNVITNDITWGSTTTGLEAGKKYTIALHLGMTSVKFTADVEAWGAGDDGNTDLPINDAP